ALHVAGDRVRLRGRLQLGQPRRHPHPRRQRGMVRRPGLQRADRGRLLVEQQQRDRAGHPAGDGQQQLLRAVAARVHRRQPGNQRVNETCNLLYTDPYRPCPETAADTHTISGSLSSGQHTVTTYGATPIKDGTPTTQTLKIDHDGPSPVTPGGEGWSPPAGLP